VLALVEGIFDLADRRSPSAGDCSTERVGHAQPALRTGQHYFAASSPSMCCSVRSVTALVDGFSLHANVHIGQGHRTATSASLSLGLSAPAGRDRAKGGRAP